jgi:hypothetical protein
MKKMLLLPMTMLLAASTAGMQTMSGFTVSLCTNI